MPVVAGEGDTVRGAPEHFRLGFGRPVQEIAGAVLSVVVASHTKKIASAVSMVAKRVRGREEANVSG